MQLLKGLATAAILATSLPGAASAQTTADLSVSLVGRPDPVIKHEAITWVITVRNLGPGPATGVFLESPTGSDEQPFAATTTQGTCLQTGASIEFSLGTIDPGGEATATVSIQAFGGDSESHGVTVSSTTEDPNLRNNSASDRVDVISEAPLRTLEGTFCPPIGGVATGAGGTAAGSQAWLATFGLLAMTGVVAAAVIRIRR